jgi:two-component sensor histidine kinase
MQFSFNHNNLSYKDKFLNIMLLIFITITTLVAIFDLFKKNTTDFLVDIIVVISSSILFIYFKKTTNRLISATLFFWLIASAAFVFNIQYQFDSNLVYLVITPIIALVLLPYKHMIIHLIIYQISILLLFFLTYYYHLSGLTIFPYNALVNYIFASSYIFSFWFLHHIIMERTFKKLKEANNNKAILLKELHHRVKNNFNLMGSLMELQQKYDTQKYTKDFIKNFKYRIDSIVVAHNLLYIHSDLNNIDLKEYIPNLFNHILQGYNHEYTISTIYNLHSLTLPIDTLIYLGMILNELLTNSIKHAFKNNQGTIYVSLKPLMNNKYVLIYEDTGKGINNINHKNGFGNMIIQMATKQINATMKQSNKIGVYYEIHFFSQEQ